jgi:hypothetical protein
MKKTTIGIFENRSDAEKFINFIHNKFLISHDDISYIYKDIFGNEKEVSTDAVASDTPREGAEKGAKAGAVLGALGGIAAVVGVIPVIGPLLVAGPLLAALGITGAVGATAAGAITGAAVGGLTGALLNLGVGEEKAIQYQDRVLAGNILVSVNSENDKEVQKSMIDHNAMNVETYSPSV